MSHWNHRVMRRTQPDEIWDAIYEVYYDENGNVIGWTESPASPFACIDLDESIADAVAMYVKALVHPTLDWETGKEI